MRFARLLASIASLAVLPAHSASASTDIPFAYRGGMIWLNVAVPGRLAPLHFLLDSGAGQSVLDVSTAKRLGVKFCACESVEGVEGCCAAFHINQMVATAAGVPLPAAMLALDLSSVSAATGAHIDGLLGADFFQSHIVQIDFGGQRIRLLDRGEIPASSQVLPIARRNDALCIRVAVNGNKPQWMRLDTGYNGALEWVATRGKCSQSNLPSVAVGARSAETIRTEVTLGSEHFAAVNTGIHQRTIFPGEDGLVGNRLLSQFCVTIDAKDSRVLLTRL